MPCEHASFHFSYLLPDSFVIEPMVPGAKEFLRIDRIDANIQIQSKSLWECFSDLVLRTFVGNLPNVDGAVQRSIHGIIGILNLIAGPYLLVITSKLRVGDIHGQPIYKIQTTDMIPYTRSLSHLNEYQVGKQGSNRDRSICLSASWNTMQNMYRWSRSSCAPKPSIFPTRMISPIHFNVCKLHRQNSIRFRLLNVPINALSGIGFYSVN